jgi:hypothetical protein
MGISQRVDMIPVIEEYVGSADNAGGFRHDYGAVRIER